MKPDVQMLVGFVIFVIVNAATQGLIPDTMAGKWVVFIASSASLWLQAIGIRTTPPEKRKANAGE